jgi:surface antigen
MKAIAIAASLALAVTGAASSAGAVGCISGAVVGGVGAHYALHGKHTVLGAVAGCAVGHHMAVVKKRKIAEEKKEAREAAHGQPVPVHH